MRRHRLSLALLATALAGPAAAAQVPPGWRVTPADGASIDREIRHGGAASAVIRGTGDITSLRQSVQPDDYRGKRLRYSAWVRSESVEELVLWMRVDGEGPMQAIAFDNMSERPITGTNDWRRHEIVLDVPPAATFVIFGILMAGNGRAWIDDVAIEVVGTGVATTGKPAAELAAMPRPQMSEEEVRAVLDARRASPRNVLNLDFEQRPPL